MLAATVGPLFDLKPAGRLSGGCHRSMARERGKLGGELTVRFLALNMKSGHYEHTRTANGAIGLKAWRSCCPLIAITRRIDNVSQIGVGGNEMIQIVQQKCEAAIQPGHILKVFCPIPVNAILVSGGAECQVMHPSEPAQNYVLKTSAPVFLENAWGWHGVWTNVSGGFDPQVVQFYVSALYIDPAQTISNARTAPEEPGCFSN